MGDSASDALIIMAGQPFTNLVRFEDDEGNVLWGDASPDRLDSLNGSLATVLDGHPFDGGLRRTNRTATIKKVFVFTTSHTTRTTDNMNDRH